MALPQYQALITYADGNVSLIPTDHKKVSKKEAQSLADKALGARVTPAVVKAQVIETIIELHSK